MTEIYLDVKSSGTASPGFLESSMFTFLGTGTHQQRPCPTRRSAQSHYPP